MDQDSPKLAYTVIGAVKTGAFSSRNKFYAAVARGDLRTFLDGKRRLVSHDALREYIARREREAMQGRAAA